MIVSLKTQTKPRQKLRMLPGCTFDTNEAQYRSVISPAPHISTSKSSMTPSTAESFLPCAERVILGEA
jgi:hypothetical protein